MQALEQENNLDWWDTDERVSTEQAAELLGIKTETFNQYRCTNRIELDVYQLGYSNFFKRSQVIKERNRQVKIQRTNRQ